MQPSTSTQLRNLFSDLHLGAILAGSVTDIISTNIVIGCYALFIVLTAARSLANQGLPQQEIQAHLTNELVNSIPTYILGCLTTILGGYVAAHLAKRKYVLHGVGAGLGVLVLGLSTNLVCGQLFPTLTSAAAAVPLWRNLLDLIITPVLAGFGGYLKSRQMERRANIQTS